MRRPILSLVAAILAAGIVSLYPTPHSRLVASQPVEVRAFPPEISRSMTRPFPQPATTTTTTKPLPRSVPKPVQKSRIPAPAWPYVQKSWISAPAPGGVWACIRRLESGGNYAADTGNGYYGAYQFRESTWLSVGGHGYPDDASPAEQDIRARMLQARAGWGQWSTASRCGV